MTDRDVYHSEITIPNEVRQIVDYYKNISMITVDFFYEIIRIFGICLHLCSKFILKHAAYGETQLKMIRRYALRRFKRNRNEHIFHPNVVKMRTNKNAKNKKKTKTMKRKLFLGLTTGISTIAAAVCITVFSVNNNSETSNLIIENIEAITQNESGGGKCGFCGLRIRWRLV